MPTTIPQSSGQLGKRADRCGCASSPIPRDPLFMGMFISSPNAKVYTDEYDSYHQLKRTHATVCHAIKEWDRDDDSDGIREVHTNTTEGMWTGV